MAKTIKIYPFASRDLESIFNYINNELHNPKAANDLMVKFEYAFNMLSLFPESCPLIDNILVKHNKNIRKLLVDNYIAFYSFEDDEIRIIRVVSERRNYYDIL